MFVIGRDVDVINIQLNIIPSLVDILDLCPENKMHLNISEGQRVCIASKHKLPWVLVKVPMSVRTRHKDLSGAFTCDG